MSLVINPPPIVGTSGKLVKFDAPNHGVDSIASESAGVITVAGDAIVTGRSRHRTTQGGGWKDLLGPFTPPLAGPSIPLLTQAGSGGVFLPKWQVNDHAIYSFHVPHDYAVGTDVYFHVHWLADGTNANTVKWQVTYFYARGYGVDAFGFGGGGTVITIEQAPSG
jgi:hypothetical protein